MHLNYTLGDLGPSAPKLLFGGTWGQLWMCLGERRAAFYPVPMKRIIRLFMHL